MSKEQALNTMATIKYRALLPTDDASAIQNLFAETFTQSVQDLLLHTAPEDLYSCFAVAVNDKESDGSKEERIVGAIFLTPFTFVQAPTRRVLILGPVAVDTSRQGQGIGQALIHYGLEQIKSTSVAEVVITYGSPVFYGKTVFQPLSTEVVAPPFVLSQPHGWLG